jgi:3-hydroxymyristoyl/3-hydroxydecanoyl-(acyl carrier protein) dehydratase
LIIHSVIFSLKHEAGSDDESAFLQAADILIGIPGVQNFKKLRQVSPKNEYDFGFSMEFADQAAYSFYNDHPDHVAFVQGRWVPEVAKFLEIDFVSL